MHATSAGPLASRHFLEVFFRWQITSKTCVYIGTGQVKTDFKCSYKTAHSMLARQNVYQAYRTILGEMLGSSWCWWWTLWGRGAVTALKDNQVPSWQVPIPKAQALGNQGQTCQWWGWIHVPVHGEAGICTAPTLHFASHFLLASEGLSCLSARTKKLPAGGGDVGKKSILFQDFTAKFPLNSWGVFSNLKALI